MSAKFPRGGGGSKPILSHPSFKFCCCGLVPCGFVSVPFLAIILPSKAELAALRLVLCVS